METSKRRIVDRDDFLALPDYSFGLCVDILEANTDATITIDRILTLAGDDARRNPEFYDALDELFIKPTATNLKIRREILATRKAKNCEGAS